MSFDNLCITWHFFQLILNKLTYFWVLHDDDDDDETDYSDDNHHAFAVRPGTGVPMHAGTLEAMLCLRWLVEVKATGLIQPVFQGAFS